MKKIIIGLAVVLLLAVGGFYGYKYVVDYASDKVVDQVINTMIDTPMIDEWLEDPYVNRLARELANIDPAMITSRELDELPFTTKEEGVKAVISKFSITELADIATSAQRGLTAQEQMEMANEVMERMSEEELEALMIVGLAELKKKLNN